MLQHRLRILRPATLDVELAAALRALPEPHLSSGALDLIDAHLMCGDFASILRLIRGADPHPALPLILARYVRWSGDLKAAAATWDAVLLSLDSPRDEDSPGLRRTTALELAPLATDLGHAQLAARLIGSARTADEPALPPSADNAAATIRTIVCESLGIEPDAVRGRLRLRPRLDLLADLDVRSIPFGDGSVDLAATIRGRTMEIRAEQGAGGVPFTLLLEPVIPSRFAFALRATVDGQPADLETRTVGSEVIVPVQLVLDDVRTVVFSSGPAG